MSKGNVAVRQFMRNKKRFADFYNVKLFQGRQIVLPEELEEIDSESDVLLKDKDGKTKAVQRHRDVVMRWKGCMDLVILACENQAKVHYAMPVRNMLYDSLSYTGQIKQLWDSHQGEEQELTQEEYLSRFRKNDRIYPVITLVWYYGSEVWDGSLDLYGMFPMEGIPEAEGVLKKYVPNYFINLVDADDIEDINQFQTDLQQIFGMLKYRGDKEKLVTYTKEHGEYFHHVDQESYLAIRELLHSEKMLKNVVKREEMEEDVDMCKALEDLYQEGIDVGIERGREQERENMCKALEDLYQEGIDVGIKRGREQVREEMQKEFEEASQQNVLRGTVEAFQELGRSEEETISKIMEKFNLDATKATETVEKFWK